jgi:hypothetical protein
LRGERPFACASRDCDDDVAWAKRWDEHLLDTGKEALAVDRAIEQAWCGDAIVARSSPASARAMSFESSVFA